MPLINIIIALILIGVGLWAINAYVPMDSKIILDRLLHRAHVLNIKGRSYRLRDLEDALRG